METRTALVLTLAFVACAHGPSPGGASDPNDEATAPHTVEENLRRLTDLDVFEVGALVLDVPDEAFNCYGPCPGWEDEIEAAEAAAADRLELFADAAEAAAAVPSTAAYDEEDVADDLASLAALEIVQIGAFLEEEPANNPSCYNLPCPDDVAAAEEANSLRAQRLDAIVTATKDY